MEGDGEEGKPVHDVSHLAWTPLHISASQGHSQAIPLLVTAGCDVNAQDEEGTTALHLAAGNGHAEVVLCLLHLGANKSLSNKEGRSALQLAQAKGHSDVIKILQAA